jgi:serine/threonine-protein kinase HipA
MSKTTKRHIEVYADWAALNGPSLIGFLSSETIRGKEVFSFEYTTDWLSRHKAHQIDPALQLFTGPNYPPQQKENFGIFLDSSPDRWGRVLMKRREALLAKKEERKEKKLLESDYLLGVYDQHRVGGLRFKENSDGPFLNNEKDLASPPWTKLKELEYACLALESENANSSPFYSDWLKMLVAPGGSLGGARPKASVVDENKNLWIAKFPSGNDSFNVGAWEKVAYILASKAGITVPNSQIKRINSKHHTFLSKRFDRTDSGERLHYCSALTLLQRNDGDDAEQGASYLELAETIIKYGSEPDKDLKKLWRRIVFSICISNVDDHLRNHGFLLNESNGWRLSPAFDINPNPDGDGLTLNISDSDNSQDLDLAKEVAQYFRISRNESDVITGEITSVVREWRKEASRLKISSDEQDQMARAFRLSEI